MTSRSAALAVSVFLAATALPVLAVDSASSDTGVSKIRVVRLSEVKGAVKMDRAIGRGMEPAVANMPIVESTISTEYSKRCWPSRRS